MEFQRGSRKAVLKQTCEVITNGGHSEYLIGRQYGLVASVNAGRISFTLFGCLCLSAQRDLKARSVLLAQTLSSAGFELVH